MKKKENTNRSLLTVCGVAATVVAGGLATGASADSSAIFKATSLGSGAQLRSTLAASYEGAPMMFAEAHGTDKAAEAKCGEDKTKEGKCGEDKTKEGKCGEGKCGEGKCGEGKKKSADHADKEHHSGSEKEHKGSAH